MSAPIKEYFKAKEFQIREIYERPNGFTYQIPRYQRPYSWKKSQIEKFFETVIENKESFLGTIIFNVDEKESKNIVKIIDGQQRYITISIFGAVLRDFSLKLFNDREIPAFKKISETFQAVYIGAEDDYQVGEHFFYLKTGISTERFFKDYIQKFDSRILNENLPIKKVELNSLTSEEKLLFDAYWKLWGLVTQELDDIYDDEKIISRLKEYRESLGRLFVVKIEIKDNTLAHEIFETVNDAGVDLSVADLIKNILFLNMPNDGKVQDVALEYWSQILDNLDSINFPMKIFLSYYWASSHKYLSDSKLYSGIKSELKHDKVKWQDFMLELVNNSELVKQIYSWSKDDVVRELTTKHRDQGVSIYKSLSLLRNTNTRTWSLLVMSILRNKEKFIKNNISLKRIFKNLEKFTFYYHFISNYPSNWFFSQMHVYARKIEAKTGEELKSVINEMHKLFETRVDMANESFSQGFSSIVYKDSKETKKLIYYIFEQLEHKLNPNSDYSGYDSDRMTIEHFLPLKPIDWGFKTMTSVKPYVNFLGNLILIPNKLNSEMGNKSFVEKFKSLSEANDLLKHAELFVENIKNKNWDFSLINGRKPDFTPIIIRQKNLSEIAYSIWHVDLKNELLKKV